MKHLSDSMVQATTNTWLKYAYLKETMQNGVEHDRAVVIAQEVSGKCKRLMQNRQRMNRGK
jgi:hypothetical protein